MHWKPGESVFVSLVLAERMVALRYAGEKTGRGCYDCLYDLASGTVLRMKPVRCMYGISNARASEIQFPARH
jgi:hypothetical protein